jgi:hypothetical protein
MGVQPLFRLPFELPPASKVLCAGAGGGSDVVCALPVVLALCEAGHDVHLANYSFTNLPELVHATTPQPGLYRIDADTLHPRDGYCPEAHLARWWRHHFHEEQPVWCYGNVGGAPLAIILQWLRQHLQFDVLVCFDAGVDGLFIGDEYCLDTPEEDATSIAAMATVANCQRIYAFTAFGSEGIAVRHADALLRLAELVRDNALLGVCAAAPTSDCGRLFLDAVTWMQDAIHPQWHSKMLGAIVASMQGRFGSTPVCPSRQDYPVWVSPLTLLYWFFEFDAVAAAKPYLSQVQASQSLEEVAEAIDQAREALGVRPRTDIPL